MKRTKCLLALLLIGVLLFGALAEPDVIVEDADAPEAAEYELLASEEAPEEAPEIDLGWGADAGDMAGSDMEAPRSNGEASGFSYELLSDGTASITGCSLTGDIVIPETIDGYTVTNLVRELFFGVSGVTSVTLPSTVTYFGDNPQDSTFTYVFSYCYDLRDIRVQTGNPSFVSKNGVLYSKDRKILYNYPCARAGDTYEVPAAAQVLDCTSFACAQNLKDLYLCSADTVWRTYTFYGDGGLTVHYLTGGQSEYMANLFIERGLSSEADSAFPTFEETEAPAPTEAPTAAPTAAPTEAPIEDSRIDIAECKITVKDQVWNGKALKPAVTVKYGKKTLEKDTDYTVAYKNNKNVGTATVTVKGVGSYTGTQKVAFQIKARNMKNATITVSKQVYTGKALKPTVKVTYGKAKLKLKEGTHYTVAYKNNKKVGLATVTVTGKGNYTGTKKATFKINPKPMELTEATAGKKQLTVKWEARKDVTGYEIQYGLKSDFKDAKTVKVSKAKTASKVIKSLKANEKYFVRIRVYKTVDKKNYYSAWSKKKAATTME